MTTKATNLLYRWLTRTVLFSVAVLMLLLVFVVGTGWYVASQQTEDRLKFTLPAECMFQQVIHKCSSRSAAKKMLRR